MANENSRKSNLPEDPIKEWFNFAPLFQERPFRNLLESIDELFQHTYFKPRFKVKVQEEEDKYIVYAELPGVRKNQIHIHTMINRLTITVKQTEMETIENDKTQATHNKQSYTQVSRTIPFYQPVLEKQTKATYRDGLLTVIVPKRKGKMIEIE